MRGSTATAATVTAKERRIVNMENTADAEAGKESASGSELRTLSSSATSEFSVSSVFNFFYQGIYA